MTNFNEIQKLNLDCPWKNTEDRGSELVRLAGDRRISALERIFMKHNSNDSSSRPMIIWVCIVFVVLSVCLAGFSIYSAVTSGKKTTAQSSKQTDSASNTSAISSIYEDPAAVSKLLADQIESYIHDRDYAMSDLAVYVESGDESVTYKLNVDKTMTAASTYKLALSMLYYDQIAEGDQTEESTLTFGAESVRDEGSNPILASYGVGAAVPIQDAVAFALHDSDNTAAAILYDNLGGWEEFCSLRSRYSKYPGIAENPLDNVCTAAQLMDEVRLLMNNQNKYKPIISALDGATADAYLNALVEEDTMIQKYGQVGGATNSVGFSKIGNPYRIVVLSNSNDNTVDAGVINKIAYNVLNQTADDKEKFWEKLDLQSVGPAEQIEITEPYYPASPDTEPDTSTPYYPSVDYGYDNSYDAPYTPSEPSPSDTPSLTPDDSGTGGDAMIDPGIPDPGSDVPAPVPSPDPVPVDPAPIDTPELEENGLISLSFA